MKLSVKLSYPYVWVFLGVWAGHGRCALYGIRYVRLSCRMTTATAAD